VRNYSAGLDFRGPLSEQPRFKPPRTLVVREKSGADDETHGVKLVSFALSGQGPLVDPELPSAEQHAIASLFRGAIGAFKNPQSHRSVQFDARPKRQSWFSSPASYFGSWIAFLRQRSSCSATLAGLVGLHIPRTEPVGRSAPGSPDPSPRPAGAVGIPRLDDRPRKAQILERALGADAYLDGDLVFADELGGTIHPQRLTQWFTEQRKTAGLPTGTLHVLRHTAATLALTSDIPVHITAARLGDTPTTVLDRYAHLLPQSDELAAERVAAAIA
jgi:hypothetical protein